MVGRVPPEVRRAYLACAQAIITGSLDLDGADASGFAVDKPIFSVSQTAELVVIHPQTLRQYDRLELIVPRRTEGGARRYSLRDIDRLMVTQHLVQDGSINLAGVSRILSLMEENRQLRRQIRRLKRPEGSSIFAAGTDGEVVEVVRALDAARLHRLEQERRKSERHEEIRGRFLPAGRYGWGLRGMLQLTDGESNDLNDPEADFDEVDFDEANF